MEAKNKAEDAWPKMKALRSGMDNQIAHFKNIIDTNTAIIKKEAARTSPADTSVKGKVTDGVKNALDAQMKAANVSNVRDLIADKAKDQAMNKLTSMGADAITKATGFEVSLSATETAQLKGMLFG